MNDNNQPFSADIDINNPEFNESGQNEVKSISDGNQALQIARRLLRDDWYRDYRRALVLSAYNGVAPYSDDELRNLGQAYRYNVSFGYMEGVVGRGLVPFNQLSGNLKNVSAVEGDLTSEKISIIQDEFITQVKNWGKWYKFISRVNQELVLYGYTSPVFPSDYSPWPVFIPQKDSFTNEGTPNDVSDLEVFCWRKQYLIHELYRKIMDPKVAEKAGWKVDKVRSALENAVPNDIWRRNTQQSGTWTAVEEAIRGGSLFNSIVGAKIINTFHVLASELDGQVTHYIVVDTPSSSPDNPPEDPTLFYRPKRWKSFRDMMVYFDFEAGDGKWHGSKGIGQRAFNIHQASDKIRNNIIDQAFTSGLVMLQANDEISNEEFNMVVTGPFAVIPPGVNVQTVNLPNISTTTFQADALLINAGEQRLGDVVPNAGGVYDKSKTATQSTIDASRAALVQKDNLQRYIDPFSQLLSIMLRRMCNENSPDPTAKAFIDAVKKKGITSDDLKKLHGMRSTGRVDDVLGETKAANQNLLAMFRGDYQVNQIKLKRRVLDAEVGPQDAEELLITPEDQTVIINAVQKQLTEIGVMINQVEVPASPNDNHMVHLQALSKWLDQQFGSIAKGEPHASIEAIGYALKHGEQHIAYMEADKMKKANAEQFKAQWQHFGDALKSLMDQMNQLQAQAQPQPQPGTTTA